RPDDFPGRGRRALRPRRQPLRQRPDIEVSAQPAGPGSSRSADFPIRPSQAVVAPPSQSSDIPSSDALPSVHVPSGEPVYMHLSELKAQHVSQLIELAASLDIENANRLR